MATPEQQIEILTKFQRLLAGGSFVSICKYALLMSLADPLPAPINCGVNLTRQELAT
jgi:hypothetical protein